MDFFFKRNNVPCIYNIDTRQLTRRLANEGAFKAAIVNFGKDPQKLDNLKTQLDKWSGLENLDLATIVSTENNYFWNEGVWNKKGTVNMEEFDPTPFMEALNQYGLPWKVMDYGSQ